MGLSFIKKVVNSKDFTPIDIESKNAELKEANFVSSSKNTHAKADGNRLYLIFFIISFLFFIAGISFWVYVNYFMS